MLPQIEDPVASDELAERVSEAYRRMLSEVKSAWCDILPILHEIGESLNNITHENAELLRDVVKGGLETERLLLLEPLERAHQRRPMRRALAAISACDSATEQLTQAVSGAIDSKAFANAGLVPYRLSRQVEPASLKARLADHFIRERAVRQDFDSNLQALLARALLMAKEPWQQVRAVRIGMVRDSRDPKAALERLFRSWTQSVRAIECEAATLFEKYDNWVLAANRRLSKGLRRGLRSTRRARMQEAYRQATSFWWRQQRAVIATLELDILFRQLTHEAFDLTAGSFNSVREEQTQIRGAITELLEWIRRSADEVAAPLPDHQVDLVPVDKRTRLWNDSLLRMVRTILPEQVELIVPRHGFIARRTRWRVVRPRDVVERALATSGEPEFRRAIYELAEANTAALCRVEQAREVIAHGLECQSMALPNGDRLKNEAIENARLLIEEEARVLDARESDSIERMIGGIAVMWFEATTALELNRIGFWAMLSRRRGVQAWELFNYLFRTGFSRASAVTAEATEKLWDALLVRAGWKLPTHQALEAVVTRADLESVVALPGALLKIPALYSKLFQSSPITEPRFLIGRDDELAGIRQALERWDSNGVAACMIVGSPGSGKTSLLNCACLTLFAGRKYQRVEPLGRLTSQAQVAEALCMVLGLDRHLDPLPALLSERRILVIEGLERAFFRKRGGLDGIRYFLDTLQSTARSTFWVLSINDQAYRYLDAAVQLGSYITHRINAMNVSPAELTAALEQRHRLSGLKLTFASPPKRSTGGRFKRRMHLSQDSREAFYDAMYERSGGNFRSAMELWQTRIGSIEGGTIEMLPIPSGKPQQPQSRQLNETDHFLLLALQQHGSLTGAEVRELLLGQDGSENLRLQRLEAMGLLEPDPTQPGLRIKAAAYRIVTDVLQRVNLA